MKDLLYLQLRFNPNSYGDFENSLERKGKDIDIEENCGF